MGDTNKYNPANKRFMILVGLITVNWIWFIMAWLTSCTADTNNNSFDYNVNNSRAMTLNPELYMVVEDSTWAETIHWHDDTTCLFNVGEYVCCIDTVDLHYLIMGHVCIGDSVGVDSVGVKKLSKSRDGWNKFTHSMGVAMSYVINNMGIKRVCEKIKRVM